MSELPPKRLLLVDGHYYLYRSFFAIRGLTNSRGEPTNAIYGFVKALRRMLVDLKPDYAAVIWDAGLPERRTQLQPEYKQHRDAMPDDLEVQQKPLQAIVPLIGAASLFLNNTEADDLIASYVMEACRNGIECVVATNDKDILQMVRPGVSIYSTAKADVGEGRGGFKLLCVPEVRAKWGVEPEQIADVLALTGDSADNIKGVPGVGGKTAAKWINQYGSLEKLLSCEGLDPKVIEKLSSSCDLVRANREMVALDLDLDLPLPISAMTVEPRYPELIEALRNCEFRSLTAEVEAEMVKLTKPETGNLKLERNQGSEIRDQRAEAERNKIENCSLLIVDAEGNQESVINGQRGDAEQGKIEDCSLFLVEAEENQQSVIINQQLSINNPHPPQQGELF